MYLQHFNLQEAPFSIAPNPRFLYLSQRHQEALAHLIYGIKVGGGFVSLTGEVGTGKTTLCRRLLEQLPENVDIALILNPKLNSLELLAAVCDELGVAYPEDTKSVKSLVDRLNRHLLESHARNRQTVLIIDEAQNLDQEVLEQIRLLTNLETSETKLLQIILVGQPELQQLLSRPELRQLNQRITARYHLQPLSLAETKIYIRHRLTVSRGNPHLFTDAAVRKIHQRAKGVPRLINIICDRSLLGAYATDRPIVGARIVNRAADEVFAGDGARRKGARLSILLFFLMLAAVGYGYYSQKIYAPVGPEPNPSRAETGRELALTPPSSSGETNASPSAANAAATVPPAPQEISQAAVGEAPEKQLPPPPPLRDFIQGGNLTLASALSDLLAVWNKSVPSGETIDCGYAKKIGLNCLTDRSGWSKLVSFDRPAVLELSLPQGEKKYLLFIGLERGLPLFRFGGERFAFPLDEVLELWQGYYLILWEPPRPGMLQLAPQQYSADVLWLRRQLADPEGALAAAERPMLFDDELKTRVVDFQRLHGLSQDGVAGPRTLVHLQNEAGNADFPRLEIIE
ncbi:MAG: AAA family ATPase [Gammaproteobacteria bacterium]